MPRHRRAHDRGPLVPTLRLDATGPMTDIVREHNAFAPESLVAYAGIAERLAHEQLAGPEPRACSRSRTSTGTPRC
jgi:hypothetical protein